jgi:hypothetical protein
MTPATSTTALSTIDEPEAPRPERVAARAVGAASGVITTVLAVAVALVVPWPAGAAAWPAFWFGQTAAIRMTQELRRELRRGRVVDDHRPRRLCSAHGHPPEACRCGPDA